MSYDSIATEFAHRIRRIQHFWWAVTFRQTGMGLLCSLLCALVARLGFSESLTAWIVVCPLLAWGGMILVQLMRDRPTVCRCAIAFDRINRTNSRVENAREMAMHERGDAFALWAIADGIQLITQDRIKLMKRRLPLSYHVFVHVVVTLLCLPWGLVLPTYAQVRHHASATVASIFRGDAAVRQKNRHVSPVLSVGEKNVWEMPSQAGSLAAGSGRGAGSSSGAVSESVGLGRYAAENRRKERNSAGQAAGGRGRNAEFVPARDSAADHGQSYSDVAWDLKNQSENLVPEDFAVSEQEVVRRQRESRVEAERTPLSSLNLCDHALPAGREAATDSGQHGDEDPTESPRGDAWGDKSAKELASMLPVLPLPDSISGMLSEGEEARRRSRSETRGDTLWKDVRSIAPVAEEPPVPSQLYPRNFRMNINLKKKDD